MWRDLPFGLRGWARFDDVAKRLLGRWSSKAAGFPLAQIVLHTTVKRVTQDNPRFEHRSGHDANLGEFLVGILWAIAPPHGHDQADNITTQFQSGRAHRAGHDMREQWIARHNHICARNRNTKNELAEFEEKILHDLAVAVIEHRETRQWRPLVTIEGRWDAPYTATPFAQLCLLGIGI